MMNAIDALMLPRRSDRSVQRRILGNELRAAVSGRVVVAMLSALCCFSADQLVEEALLTVRGRVLIEQREPGLVEFVKKLIPRDLLETVVVGIRRLGKDQADDARIFAAMRRFDGSRFAAARFRPFSNLVVIGGNLGSSRLLFRHRKTPLFTNPFDSTLRRQISFQFQALQHQVCEMQRRLGNKSRKRNLRKAWQI
jgi:hypothetical protein